jgi:hypothetical protein
MQTYSFSTNRSKQSLGLDSNSLNQQWRYTRPTSMMGEGWWNYLGLISVHLQVKITILSYYNFDQDFCLISTALHYHKKKLLSVHFADAMIILFYPVIYSRFHFEIIKYL